MWALLTIHSRRVACATSCGAPSPHSSPSHCGCYRQLASTLAPGGIDDYAKLAPALVPTSGHDIRPQVAVTVAGGVGFPEFAVDGIANRNERGRISLAPHTDTVEEVQIDTANFDASGQLHRLYAAGRALCQNQVGDLRPEGCYGDEAR